MAAIAVSEQYAEACGFLKLAVGQVVARLACHERASNFPTRTRSTRSANFFFVAIWPLATFRGLRAIGPVRTRI